MDVSISPLPRATAVGPKKKKGTSIPTRAPISASRSLPNPAPRSWFAATITAAALPLPPPRPAATGMFFLIAMVNPTLRPAALRTSSAAFQAIFPSPEGTSSASQLHRDARSAQRHRNLIKEPHHLHQHLHLMVSVGPFAQYRQAEIYLCRGPECDRFHRTPLLQFYHSFLMPLRPYEANRNRRTVFSLQRQASRPPSFFCVLRGESRFLRHSQLPVVVLLIGEGKCFVTQRDVHLGFAVGHGHMQLLVRVLDHDLHGQCVMGNFRVPVEMDLVQQLARPVQARRKERVVPGQIPQSA